MGVGHPATKKIGKEEEKEAKAMLQRKPSKIEVKAEDREELEEAIRLRHQRTAAASAPSAAASSSSSATSLLQSLLLKKPSLDPAEKAHLMGIPKNP